MHHFLRGVLDGDGHIVKYRKKPTHDQRYLGFTGQKAFLLFIQVHLNNAVRGLYPVSVCKKKGNNAASLVWGKKSDVTEIARYLYRDATVFLDRKWEKVKDLI